MGYVITAVVALVVYWIVGTVIAQIDEDYAVYWACGLVYPVAWVLSYPIRASRRYDRSQAYFEKNGISKVQYVLGKRVKHDV